MNCDRVANAATWICHLNHSTHVYVHSSALSVRHVRTRCLEANAPTAVESLSFDPGVLPTSWQTIHLQRRASLILLGVRGPRSEGNFGFRHVAAVTPLNPRRPKPSRSDTDRAQEPPAAAREPGPARRHEGAAPCARVVCGGLPWVGCPPQAGHP